MDDDVRIPPKKYRDKVRRRLEVVCELLLADEDRLKELLKRIGRFEMPDGPPTLPERIEQLRLLLKKDVPALLDVLDRLVKRHQPPTGECHE